MAEYLDDTEEDVVEKENGDEYFMLQVMDKKQEQLFDKISEAISAREDVSQKLISDLVKKISSSIASFVRELRLIKIEVPESKQPIVNVKLEEVSTAIQNATKLINENQTITNDLLQSLIDSKVTEWKLTVDKLDAAGRISEVIFKAKQ